MQCRSIFSFQGVVSLDTSTGYSLLTKRLALSEIFNALHGAAVLQKQGPQRQSLSNPEAGSLVASRLTLCRAVCPGVIRVTMAGHLPSLRR